MCRCELDYLTGNPRALGGNPDIYAVNAKTGKPVYLQGPANPPLPQEAGWKDTITVYPGQVTRLSVRWAPSDLPLNAPLADLFFPFDPDGGHGYVWHCHIIDHEDNEDDAALRGRGLNPGHLDVRARGGRASGPLFVD